MRLDQICQQTDGCSMIAFSHRHDLPYALLHIVRIIELVRLILWVLGGTDLQQAIVCNIIKREVAL